jgi:hypothetical protein
MRANSGGAHAVTDLVVLDVLAGDLGGASAIKLRQLGVDGMKSDSFTPVVAAGQTYVLFLKPFTFGTGAGPSGQYVITGDQGAYEAVGGSYHRISPGGPELPVDVSIGQVRGAVS